MTDNERYIRDRATVISIIKYVLIVAVSGVLLFFATRVISVMIPFLIGFLLAKTAHGLAAPLVKHRSKKPGFNTKKKKRIEITIYGFVVFVVILAALYGIFTLFVQGTKAFTAISNLVVTFSDPNKLNDTIWQFSESHGGIIKDSVIEKVVGYFAENSGEFLNRIPEFIGKAVSSIWSIIGNIPYAIFVVISVFMSGYYFLSDGPNVLKMYMKSVPNHSFRRSSLELVNNLSGTLFRALGGYTLLLIITMAEAWIAFYFAGVEFALVLALVTAILDFLPVLGISATMVPVIVYCVFHNNYKGAVILIIAMAIMTVIRRFIEPAIVGKSLHLHPLVMLISMALGVYIWGAVGFLLGPVVFIIVLDVFKVFGIDKKLSSFLSRVLERFMKTEPDFVPSETSIYDEESDI